MIPLEGVVEATDDLADVRDPRTPAERCYFDAIGVQAEKAAMLLLATKSVTIGDHVVKLFSIDRKLWCTRPSDIRIFKLRKRGEEEQTRRLFAEFVGIPSAPATYYRRRP